MRYNLTDCLNDLIYTIHEKREIGLFENDLATYYKIPVFAKNSLVTIVINKKSGAKFFYCNGKKIKLNSQDSAQMHSITKTAIDDEIKILKRMVASGDIKTIPAKGGIFAYYINALSPINQLAYGTNYRKLDITCKLCKDIIVTPSNYCSYDIITTHDDPDSIMYIINEFETQKEYLLTHNKLSGQYQLSCDNIVDNKYFHYKFSSLMHIAKTKKYEQLLADVFNNIEKEYKSRHR